LTAYTAVQTQHFNSNSLQFLTVNNVEGFSDTTGTQKFGFAVDRLFDTFNSHSPKASGYKQALTVVLLTKSYV